MSTIRFILRNDKDRASGPAAIGMLYQVSGKRKYIGTRYKVYPANWDEKAQQAIYKDPKKDKALFPGLTSRSIPRNDEIKAINEGLQELVSEVERIERGFGMQEKSFTADDVSGKLKELIRPLPGTDKIQYLPDFIDKYIKDHQAIREEGSLQVYRSLRTHLLEYKVYRGQPVRFEEMGNQFFTKFFAFLVSKRGIINITANKQIGTLKTILNYAKDCGIELPERYNDYKVKKEQLEVIALDEAEFLQLYNYEVPEGSRLDRVKDICIFSATTGLRYSDSLLLKWENVRETSLSVTVKKTRQQLTIPLTAYSIAILHNYRDHSKPLPMISGQKLNDYIKELCMKAGISSPVEVVRYRGDKRVSQTFPKYELLSVHSFRKSFASISLAQGIPVSDVMAVGGWSDYSSFKRYVKVSEDQKAAAMAKAWGEPLVPKKSGLKAV